ncbi:MAG: ABC transporter ATP-binding protein [Candidatus Neomarinimicrobiota bacterium]
MIEIKSLNFTYRKKSHLFDDLNMSVAPASICGLLGKNGAGKTTLLKILTGLLFPKSGSVSVLGKNPANRLPETLKEIYLIPEEFYLPELTVREYARLYAPFYPRFNNERLMAHLTDFELPENDKLSSLSYGQKKKFLIAFGLATDCHLLLLDEPTNGLDIPSKSQFRKILASSLTDDRTFIISTHQVRDMGNLIDPIIILDDGKIIFHESVESVNRKLAVRFLPEVPENESVLYSEKMLDRFVIVSPNPDGEETKMDIELLFNTVILNREKIQSLFTKEANHEA